MNDINEILSRLEGVEQRSPNRWQAMCPVHEDKKPSLSISTDGDTLLLYCHANCNFKDIIAALDPSGNTKSRPLTPVPEKPKNNGHKKIVANYPYFDADGTSLYLKVRFEPKDFAIKQASGQWGMGNTEPVLYNLPAVASQYDYGVVYITEGEKDADRLNKLGLVATCNFDGAGKWRDEYNKYLARKVVYILPDNDEVGYAHSELVASKVKPVAQAVKVVTLPDLVEHQDVSDWLDLGNTKDELEHEGLMTPAWEPARFKKGDYVDVIIKDRQQNKRPAEVIYVLPFQEKARSYLVNLDGDEKTLEESNLVPTTGKIISPIWQIRTLHDAYQPRPPMVYAVDGMFALPSINIVYGAPGTLKSMLLADACICVAGGMDWLPRLKGNNDVGPGIKTIQNPILWIDMDNGRRRTDERFDALGKARGLAPDIPAYYVSMPIPSLDMTKEDTVIILQGYIMQLGAKIVVIDNLGLVSGETDENSAAMVNVMGRFRQVAEETETAIILIHHQRKTYGGQNSRAGDSLRGHSSIEAAIDLALLVMREPGDIPAVIVKSTKERSVPVPQFAAMFTYEHVPGTKDLMTAKFFNKQILSEYELVALRATNLLTDKSMSKGDLAESLKEDFDEIGINKLRDYIEEMVLRDQIVEIAGLRNAKILKVKGVFDA